MLLRDKRLWYQKVFKLIREVPMIYLLREYVGYISIDNLNQSHYPITPLQIWHQTVIGWLLSCDCILNISLVHRATNSSSQKNFESFYMFTKMSISQQLVELDLFYKESWWCPISHEYSNFSHVSHFHSQNDERSTKTMIILLILADFDKKKSL